MGGRWICGCSIGVGVLGALILIVAIVVGQMGAEGITTLPSEIRVDTEAGLDPTNLIRYTWLPGCREGNKTDEEIDKCGGSCFNSSFISQIESFYKSINFKN